jgi:hypothetical protein
VSFAIGDVTINLIDTPGHPDAFVKAVEETVHETLRQGIHGWQVTDWLARRHGGFALGLDLVVRTVPGAALRSAARLSP